MVEAKFKVFINSNYEQNCNSMKQFIQNNEFKKDQLMSVTSCVKDVKDDDHVFVCVYRNRAIDASTLPVDQIRVETGDARRDWDD